MAYEILEIIRRTIKDDEYIDIRLIMDFIKDERARLLEDAFKRKRDFYRFVQIYNKDNKGKTELELINDNELTSVGITLFKSKQKITKALLLNNKEAITKVAPINILMDNFKFMNYDEAVYAGYGKFNKFMNVAFLKNGYLYVKAKDNAKIRGLRYVRLEGIFEDPTQVAGFDEEVDDYPISANIWNTLIDNVNKLKLQIKLVSQEDEENDANAEIGQEG